MRYLMLTKASDQTPDERLFTEMAAFVDELTKAGVILAAGGLDTAPTRVSSADGEFSVTDGPFTEASEVIGGFALVEVRSKEEAIELARRTFAIGGDGEGFIQEVFG